MNTTLDLQQAESKRLRWHRLSYALAAFSIATIVLSMFLTHAVLSIHQASVTENQAWVQRRSKIADLVDFAAAVNAPGNDAFESGDIAKESERLTRAMSDYEARLREVSDEIQTSVPDETGAPILRLLANFDADVRRIQTEALAIFRDLGNGDKDPAGEHMAAMDRELVGAMARHKELREAIGAIQTSLFKHHTARASGMAQLSIGILALLVVTAAGAIQLARASRRLIESEQSVLQENERRLRASEDRFRSVVEAASNAMVMVDRDRRITLVNSRTEELFGYRREELVGQLIEILVPERFRSHHPEVVEHYLREPQARTMGAGRDLFGRKKNGDEVLIEIGLSPITTGEGLFVLASIIDITERKRVELALRAAKDAADSANKSKSSFLANMSHEIRTPMNGIIGMSQLLARTELRSHQRDYLTTIDESAHILLRLLNDILDFSKIEAGKLELETVDFRLSECAGRATQMLMLRAAEKGLEIACRISPEIPDHLRGDPGRLQQVLVNLLSNAVKFTEAGEILVNVNVESREGERVRLRFSVSDTGIGIPADKHDQIFHPFEQAESSTTRRFGGTGLGLTITQQIVGLMGGSVWLESEVGRGSTFSFTAEFGVSTAAPSHTPAELDSLRELPVLVVDDNFTNRRILGELLQHWRMRPVLVDSAQSARDAIRRAHESQQPIRLILLDHHMPGEDGFQFADSVRDLLRRDRCSIIMISSGTSPIDVDQGQQHGIDRFMTKPVIASELLNEVLRQFGGPAAAQPVQPVAEAKSTAVPPRRVLLVEDNEINRRVAIGLLRSRGHQVEFAENGQQALDVLAVQEFDVVLMDMQMPVLDGYEATTAIRQREHETGGHIPIVAMTAEALKGDRDRCLAAGMDDYISKPISPAALHRAVERFPALCLADESPIGPQTAATEKRAGEAHAEPPSEVPPTTTIVPAVDWNVAAIHLPGGRVVLLEFSELARTQTPKLMSEIRTAIASRDFQLLRRSAHTLKGTALHFGAEPLIQAAQALENHGRNESSDGVPQLLAALESEAHHMLAALELGPPDSMT